MSIKVVLSLLGLVAMSAAITYWLIYLVRYGGADICDKTQYDNCPFPPYDKEGRKDRLSATERN